MNNKFFNSRQLQQILKVKEKYEFIKNFISIETLSGFILFTVTVFAVIIANSSYSDFYFDILKSPISIGFGESSFSMSTLHWINDVLMAIFFLVVGLRDKKRYVCR